MKQKTLLIGLGLALFLGYIIYSLTAVAQVSCEVCVTYKGRTECRAGAGANEEEALRTATDVACAVMSSGMTEGIACSNAERSRVMCTSR